VTILDDIVAAHQASERPGPDVIDRAAAATTLTRDFRGALAAPGLSVIAEIKRRSPSKGPLAPDLDPALLAKAYAAGGAAALSVLTDREFFGGSPEDLAAARAAVDLPVLRKDFTLDQLDVAEARLMGADAVLLIVAVLGDSGLGALIGYAASVGLAALVEVHDEAELERALAAGAEIVGVNQRDLRTFEIDRTLAARLTARVPEGIVTVAESGIRSADDVPDGIDAILVGETLVTSADPSAALRNLCARGESS
jgi:indole-3-glycerol phosphate synthase